MSQAPNPATVAARFGRRPLSARTLSEVGSPQPAGWDDSVAMPIQEHFYVDTGIFHSLACSMKVLGLALLPVLQSHERNDSISAEARTQASSTTLSAMIAMLLPAMEGIARLPCAIATDLGKIETIRSELISDAQQRHHHLAQNLDGRVRHGGEAELIHLAEGHEPTARLISNDAGASAVARVHGVATVHFLHVLRAAVAGSLVTVDEALSAARDGFSESGLATSERRRTECSDWLCPTHPTS